MRQSALALLEKTGTAEAETASYDALEYSLRRLRAKPGSRLDIDTVPTLLSTLKAINSDEHRFVRKLLELMDLPYCRLDAVAVSEAWLHHDHYREDLIAKCQQVFTLEKHVKVLRVVGSSDLLREAWTLPFLRRALAANQRETRVEAVKTIFRHSAFEPLHETLSINRILGDKSEEVRSSLLEAYRTWIKVELPSFVPLAVQIATHDDDAYVRRSAIEHIVKALRFASKPQRDAFLARPTLGLTATILKGLRDPTLQNEIMYSTSLLAEGLIPAANDNLALVQAWWKSQQKKEQPSARAGHPCVAD